MELPSKHKVVKLVGEELAEQQRDFEAYDFDIVRLQPGNWLMPMPFTKYAPDIYNMEVRRNKKLWNKKIKFIDI